MIFAMLMAAAQPQMGAEIGRWCAVNQPRSKAACVTVQKQQLRYFLGHMGMYRDPGHKVAQHCMTSAKVPPSIDWRKATSCFRGAAKTMKNEFSAARP